MISDEELELKAKVVAVGAIATETIEKLEKEAKSTFSRYGFSLPEAVYRVEPAERTDQPHTDHDG